MQETGLDTIWTIHGTGAAAASDEGTAWWQRGSDFTSALEQRLRDPVQLGPGAAGNLFHWSGENSEVARRRAGRDLYRLLEGEDRKGPFHLIGHSHGGSVIWHALCEAQGRGNPLSNLRSWSTVATPFLHYSTRLSFLWLLLPIAAIIGLAATITPWGIGFLRETRFNAMDWSLTGIYTIAGLVGLLLLVPLMIYGAVLVRGLLAWFQGPKHRKRQEDALRTFGERHLAIWSPDDEAINGLAKSVGGVNGSLMPRVPWPSELFTATTASVRLRALLAAPILSLLAPVNNLVLAPLVDGLVFRRITHKLQGNDIGSDDLCRVTPGPLADLANDPLPIETSTQLREKAESYAAALVSRIRDELGIVGENNADVPVIFGRIGKQLTWKELIHNTYFEHPDVQSLLAAHIASGTSVDRLGALDRHELVSWYEQARAHGRSTVAAMASSDPPESIRPGASLGARLAPGRAIARAAQLAVLGSALLLPALFAYLIAERVLLPYTRDFQLQAMSDAITIRDFVDLGGNASERTAAISPWLFTLSDSGHLGKVNELLTTIRFPMDRIDAAVAFANGRMDAGRNQSARSALESVLSTLARMDPRPPNDTTTPLIVLSEPVRRLGDVGLWKEMIEVAYRKTEQLSHQDDHDYDHRAMVFDRLFEFCTMDTKPSEAVAISDLLIRMLPHMIERRPGSGPQSGAAQWLIEYYSDAGYPEVAKDAFDTAWNLYPKERLKVATVFLTSAIRARQTEQVKTAWNRIEETIGADEPNPNAWTGVAVAASGASSLDYFDRAVARTGKDLAELSGSPSAPTLDLHRGLLLAESAADKGDDAGARKQITQLVETVAGKRERLDAAFLTRIGALWAQLLPFDGDDNGDRAFEDLLERLQALDEAPRQLEAANQPEQVQRDPDALFTERYAFASGIQDKKVLTREMLDLGRPDRAVYVWIKSIQETKCPEIKARLTGELAASAEELTSEQYEYVLEESGVRLAGCLGSKDLPIGSLLPLLAPLDPRESGVLAASLRKAQADSKKGQRDLLGEAGAASEKDTPPGDPTALAIHGQDLWWLLRELLEGAELALLTAQQDKASEHLTLAEDLLRRIDWIETETGADLRRDIGRNISIEPWTLIGQMRLKIDQPAAAKNAFDRAYGQTLPLQDNKRRSPELARIAMGFGSLGYHRAARLSADQCLAADRMQVYPKLVAQMGIDVPR